MTANESVRAGEVSWSSRKGGVRLAECLALLPPSRRAFHRWMRVLEVVGLALIAGALALALVVSIDHAGVAGTSIAAAWFALPASAAPFMIVHGIRTLVLRASLPLVASTRSRAVVTGSRAVRLGWGLVAGALAAGAFWGILAYAAWTFDVALIGVYARLLGTALGVVIPAAIVLAVVSSLSRHFGRTR